MMVGDMLKYEPGLARKAHEAEGLVSKTLALGRSKRILDSKLPDEPDLDFEQLRVNIRSNWPSE